MDKRLEEIEERANHQNLWPGPWWINEPWKPTNPRFGNQCRIIDENGVWIAGVEKNNAEFIANSREDIPYLLSIIRQQREALEEISKSRIAQGWDDTNGEYYDCSPCEDKVSIASKALSLTAKTEEKP